MPGPFGVMPIEQTFPTKPLQQEWEIEGLMGPNMASVSQAEDTNVVGIGNEEEKGDGGACNGAGDDELKETRLEEECRLLMNGLSLANGMIESSRGDEHREYDVSHNHRRGINGTEDRDEEAQVKIGDTRTMDVVDQVEDTCVDSSENGVQDHSESVKANQQQQQQQRYVLFVEGYDLLSVMGVAGLFVFTECYLSLSHCLFLSLPPRLSLSLF